MPRRRPPLATPDAPIVALTTDFGITDSYVAEMKAVLLAGCPNVRVVDVTHMIPPQDVLSASVTLERALRIFPRGTIHVAVVDPGVGSSRKLLLVALRSQLVLCPDNGLITWPWRRLPCAAHAYELTPHDGASPTFHGRDVLAPAAADLASGRRFVSELAPNPVQPVLLDIAPASAPKPATATIIHVDHFGNATTNVPAEFVRHSHAPKRIRLGDRPLGPIRRTYADVSEGEPLALIGSSDLLEIAVRNGHAARELNLKPGDQLTIEY